MPDTPEPSDATDDPIHALAPDAQATDEQLAAVQAALAGLSFLSPDDGPAGADASAEADEPMPPDVWARLQGTLADESSARATAGLPATGTDGATVTSLDAARASGRSGGRRWTSGLVAASVAVVAVGLGVGVLRTGSGALVAGDAGSTPAPVAASAGVAAADASPEALSAEAAPGLTAEAKSAPPDAASPASASTLTLEAPSGASTQVVLASNTVYAEDDTALRTQVKDLVEDTAQITTPDKAMAAPTQPLASGMFTSSLEELGNCLETLLGSTSARAFLVDTGRYGDRPAGLVVAEASTDAGMRMFDVWVVDSDCQRLREIQDFPLFSWTPPTP